MEKLVVKTAVKTVLVILIIFIGVFAVFNFAFPQHMASVTESIGNYSLAVKYASLRYSYTKDASDLARCFDDSVLLDDQEYVLEYGEKLISDKDFEIVCDKKDLAAGTEYYRARVYSKVAIAAYKTGDTDKAISYAEEENGGKSDFAYGNAFMLLTAQIRSDKNAEAAALLKTEIEGITPATDKEAEYKDLCITALKSVISSSSSNG